MGLRKRRVGVVVSDKMDKSCVVIVKREVRDPMFQKYMSKRAKFMAHDEENKCKIGDQVEIVECRPISKNKCWRISKVLVEAK